MTNGDISDYIEEKEGVVEKAAGTRFAPRFNTYL